jgi:hypothetical protein
MFRWENHFFLFMYNWQSYKNAPYIRLGISFFSFPCSRFLFAAAILQYKLFMYSWIEAQRLLDVKWDLYLLLCTRKEYYYY